MRKFCALVFGFMPLSLCLTSSVALANSSSFSFSKSWGADPTNELSGTFTRCDGRISKSQAFSDCMNTAENSVQLNLPENFEITCRVNKHGVNTTTELQKNGIATAEDLFYCEQAISEAFSVSPYNDIEGVGQLQSRNRVKDAEAGAKAQYLKLHPELAGKIVVLHIIPTSVTKLCQGITKRELDSSENLAAISIANLHSELLKAFRSDWTGFCGLYTEDDESTTLRRSVLLKKADEMMTKYKALFL